MRLGIFSDIHANLEALCAVLEAYRTERIDVYYCLGDTVGYGGSPNECADLVRETAKKTILGNHDAAVSGRMDYSYYYEAARHALDAHAAMLSDENMAWLKGLPYQEKLDDMRRPALPRLARAPRRVRVHLRARAGARVPVDRGTRSGTSRSSGTRTCARCSPSRRRPSRSYRPPTSRSSRTRSTS